MTDAKPTRRSFLTLLGLAPIAAPVVVAAATAPKPATLRWTTMTGAPYLRDVSRRILLADEVDTYAATASQGSTAELIKERLITWPEGPEKDRLRTEFADFMESRKSLAALAEWRPNAAIACPVFIDDVGSGP